MSVDRPDSVSRRLAAYVVRRPGFRFIESGKHVHVGALLADAALQAGLNYRSVVWPRVSRLERSFPSAASMTGLAALLNELGASELLNWRHEVKLARFELLVHFFRGRVETVADIGAFIASYETRFELTKLKGIGEKTVDYLFRLTGGQEVAVDRHVIRFVEDAGIRHESYAITKEIVGGAADLLGVSRDCFDASIWRFMSERYKFHGSAISQKEGELSLA